MLDVFTRSVRGWSLSRLIDQELTLSALRMADHTPQIHPSDQGIQSAAQAYIKLLKAHDTQISMAAIGKDEENGYVERFMRTFLVTTTVLSPAEVVEPPGIPLPVELFPL